MTESVGTQLLGEAQRLSGEMNANGAAHVRHERQPPLTYEEKGEMGPLYAALAKAQGAFEAIAKTRTVTVRPRDPNKPSYTFDYAELDEVIRKTRPALAANELGVIQPFHGVDAGKMLETKLVHSSGASITVKVRVPEANTIQDLGSSLTYLRRYSYSCLLGVASESDDDGNAAVGNEAQQSARPKAAPPPPKEPAKMSRQLRQQIWDIATKQAGFTTEELRAFAMSNGVDKLDEATELEGKKVLDALNALKVHK